MAILRDIEEYIYWDAKRQMYLPRYWRKEVLPSWLGFDGNDPLTPGGVLTVLAAPGVTPPARFVQPYASVEGLDENLGTPFEVRSLVFEDSTDSTAAANFTVLLQEVGELRLLSNAPVHIRTLAGTAQLPAILREPLFIPSRHVVSAICTKIGGGATNIRMFMVGAQYFPWSPEFLRYRQDAVEMKDRIRRWMQRRQTVSPFWLTTDQPTVLVGGGTADVLLKAGNDAQFEAFTISAVFTGAFEWSLSEAKTLQTLMNGTVTGVNSMGTAQWPIMLPSSYILAADKRLRLRLTDLSGAGNTIWFTIGGRKIYAPFMRMREALADTAVPTPADSQALIVPKPME